MGEKKHEEGRLKISTVLSYALATGTGAQFIATFIGTYASIFLTDIFGVPAAVAGVIITVGTIWDAMNALIMGSVADHTRSKWGKYRPYLLYVPVPLAIISVLFFACPNLSTEGKIVWAAIFYILYGTFATAIQIPHGAIINAITDKDSQRHRLVSSYTFVMGIVTTIASSFALVFVAMAGQGDDAKGYRIVMLLAGIVLVLSNWFCFACTKEKYVSNEVKGEPLRHQLKKLLKVKGLVPVIVVWCMAHLGFQGMMGSSAYYITYYVGDESLIAPYMLVISFVGLLGIAVVLPIFSKCFKDVRTGFVVSQVLTAIANIVLFLVGGKSIAALFVITAIASVFSTMSNAYVPLLMAEMIDFVYYKTGSQLNATVGALRGFAAKCASAVTSAVLMFTLSATGYVANAKVQTPTVLMGIHSVRFLVPAVSAIIVVIALMRYPVNTKVKSEMENLYSENK